MLIGKREMLRIGDSGEQALLMLGNPSKTYICEGSHNAGAGGSAHEWSGERAPNYFYNYFHLGIDILVEGRSKRVKKIILHTNNPLHPDFGLYERCHFEMKIDIAGMEAEIRERAVEEEEEKQALE